MYMDETREQTAYTVRQDDLQKRMLFTAVHLCSVSSRLNSLTRQHPVTNLLLLLKPQAYFRIPFVSMMPQEAFN